MASQKKKQIRLPALLDRDSIWNSGQVLTERQSMRSTSCCLRLKDWGFGLSVPGRLREIRVVVTAKHTACLSGGEAALLLQAKYLMRITEVIKPAWKYMNSSVACLYYFWT